MNHIDDYDFSLPHELIAYEPPKNRGDSRLITYKNNIIIHGYFKDILDHINPGDALVINNTKVSNVRLYGQKPTGGKIEVLILKPLDGGLYQCFIKGLGQKHLDQTILLENQLEALVVDFDEENSTYKIKPMGDLKSLIKDHGKIPLPPYIKRESTKEDEERYQTVYAKETPFGAVAAPTAGLHFTHELLEKLKEKGVKIVELTLHVGPGTFLPVKVSTIDQHIMHKEFFIFNDEASIALNDAKKNGGKIIAVGTTSLRVIESVKRWTLEKGLEEFCPYEGETDIFIKPGSKVLSADGLITNFHLPKSTLFILICAILGRDKAIEIYKEAIKEKYRFFSYGDACFFEIK